MATGDAQRSALALALSSTPSLSASAASPVLMGVGESGVAGPAGGGASAAKGGSPFLTSSAAVSASALGSSFSSTTTPTSTTTTASTRHHFGVGLAELLAATGNPALPRVLVFMCEYLLAFAAQHEVTPDEIRRVLASSPAEETVKVLSLSCSSVITETHIARKGTV